MSAMRAWLWSVYPPLGNTTVGQPRERRASITNPSRRRIPSAETSSSTERITRQRVGARVVDRQAAVATVSDRVEKRRQVLLHDPQVAGIARPGVHRAIAVDPPSRVRIRRVDRTVVQVEDEDLPVLREDTTDAVALVGIEVDVHDAVGRAQAAIPAQHRDGHPDIRVDAEPFAAVRSRVVEPPGQVERKPGVQRGPGGFDRPARRPAHRAKHEPIEHRHRQPGELGHFERFGDVGPVAQPGQVALRVHERQLRPVHRPSQPPAGSARSRRLRALHASPRPAVLSGVEGVQPLQAEGPDVVGASVDDAHPPETRYAAALASACTRPC